MPSKHIAFSQGVHRAALSSASVASKLAWHGKAQLANLNGNERIATSRRNAREIRGDGQDSRGEVPYQGRSTLD